MKRALLTCVAAVAAVLMAGTGAAQAAAAHHVSGMPTTAARVVAKSPRLAVCGSEPNIAYSLVRHDLNGDGVKDTIAAITCAYATGSTPSEVVVFLSNTKTGKAVRHVLVKSEPLLLDPAVKGRKITLTWASYKITDSGCCPTYKYVQTFTTKGHSIKAGRAVREFTSNSRPAPVKKAAPAKVYLPSNRTGCPSASTVLAVAKAAVAYSGHPLKFVDIEVCGKGLAGGSLSTTVETDAFEMQKDSHGVWHQGNRTKICARTDLPSSLYDGLCSGG